MNYIEPYKIFKQLNESLLSDDQRLVNKAFLNMADPNTGTCIWDGEVINPSDVVNIVERALNEIQDEWPYWYSFLMNYNLIWATKSGLDIDTMAVDKYLNLYINPVFVQKYLKNKLNYTQFVLMHEMMHCVFNHVKRGSNYLENTTKPREWEDTNLAGDLEINTFLVLLNTITRDEIKNEIGGGVILDEVDTVIAMEEILDDDNLMNKLQPWKHNKLPPQETEKQEMSPEWKNGFNDASKIIDDLVEQGLTTQEIVDAINKIKEDKIRNKNN